MSSSSSMDMKTDKKSVENVFCPELLSIICDYDNSIMNLININDLEKCLKYTDNIFSENMSDDVWKFLLTQEKFYTDKKVKVLVKDVYTKGRVEIVKLLLKHFYIYPMNFAIDESCYRGHTEIVKMLIDDKRIDPSVNNNFCLIKACSNNYTEIAQILLNDKRVNPGINGGELIKMVSELGCIDTLKFLIGNEKIFMREHEKEAAIHLATENNHPNLVKLLETECICRECPYLDDDDNSLY